MSRQCQQSRGDVAAVDRDTSDGLHGIGVEDHPVVGTAVGDFGNRVDGADLVVGPHHTDQGSVGFDRSGDLRRIDLPGCVAADALESESVRLAGLAKTLAAGIRERLEGVHVNGHPDDRLPGNMNLGFEGVDGDALLAGLKRIAVSSGSACTTADPGTSHVLAAMGVPQTLSRASLRFGLGRFNTEDDILAAIDDVVGTVERLRTTTRPG